MNPATRERELLEAAQDGDEQAFRALVEQHRPELHAHCYRMLGSVQDAEDALQDALLRAWRGLPRFQERSSLRSWLYRIATNTTLDVIARRPKRVLPVDYVPHADPHDSLDPPSVPLTETVWMEPYPDDRIGLEDGPAAPEARYEQREGVELAFVAALQHLPPNQRAALILREVLGFSAREVAESLDTSTASVNSALQRARALVEERVPERSQQVALRELGDERLTEIVERYSEALEEGDVDALLAMLTDDATWSMPPLPNWYRGSEAITHFLHKGPFTVQWRHLPARANGQAAVAGYVLDEGKGAYEAFALDVLRFRGAQIAEVNAFLDGRIFEQFGLPPELPA